MSENSPSRNVAGDTAEKILTAIYGEDLRGCPVSLDSVILLVQEGINAEARSHKMLNEALIGALRQIQAVSTPPAKEEIQTMEEVISVLGERADAIHQVTTKILEAWEKTQGKI